MRPWQQCRRLSYECIEILGSVLAHRSWRLTRWAYSIARLCSPSSSVIVHTFEQKYLQNQLANFMQFFSVASLGKGKGCIRFWGRDQVKTVVTMALKLPLTYNGKNGVSVLSQSPVIGSLSNLQVTRTHKILDEFEFGPGRTFHYGVIRLWAFPLTLNGENDVSIFSQLLSIQSSSNFQITRTGIKSWTSSNFGHIWSVILELLALERWQKWCLQLFSVTFDWIFVKPAGNEDRHKSLNGFKFRPDRINHFGVIRPWAGNFFPVDL